MNSPLIIAHRGARDAAPENSVAAFRRAIELGADGIELDTLLTRDNVPVVTHNDDLSILTHKQGLIHKSLYREVSIHSIPSLAEVLKLIAAHDIFTIIEIKAQPSRHRLAAKIVGQAVIDQAMTGHVIISSFSPKIIYWLRRLYPEIPRAFIVKRGRLALLKTIVIGILCRISAVHVGTRALTAKLVASAQKRHWQVDPWTVNTEEDIERCMKLGVHGMITDDVPFVQSYLGESLKKCCKDHVI